MTPAAKPATHRSNNPNGRPARPSIDRFLERVKFAESRYAGTRCLLWQGYIDESGYGRFRKSGKDSESRTTMAHRWLYERWVAPVPADMVLDHLCHDPFECREGVGCLHRRCVNPMHIAVVTRRENNQRMFEALKPICKNGHPLTPGNMVPRPEGGRRCLACRAESNRRRVERQRLARTGGAA